MDSLTHWIWFLDFQITIENEHIMYPLHNNSNNVKEVKLLATVKVTKIQILNENRNSVNQNPFNNFFNNSTMARNRENRLERYKVDSESDSMAKFVFKHKDVNTFLSNFYLQSSFRNLAGKFRPIFLPRPPIPSESPLSNVPTGRRASPPRETKGRRRRLRSSFVDTGANPCPMKWSDAIIPFLLVALPALCGRWPPVVVLAERTKWSTTTAEGAFQEGSECFCGDGRLVRWGVGSTAPERLWVTLLYFTNLLVQSFIILNNNISPQELNSYFNSVAIPTCEIFSVNWII